jgi:hypothetical protein
LDAFRFYDVTAAPDETTTLNPLARLRRAESVPGGEVVAPHPAAAAAAAAPAAGMEGGSMERVMPEPWASTPSAPALGVAVGTPLSADTHPATQPVLHLARPDGTVVLAPARAPAPVPVPAAAGSAPGEPRPRKKKTVRAASVAEGAVPNAAAAVVKRKSVKARASAPDDPAAAAAAATATATAADGVPRAATKPRRGRAASATEDGLPHAHAEAAALTVHGRDKSDAQPAPAETGPAALAIKDGAAHAVRTEERVPAASASAAAASAAAPADAGPAGEGDAPPLAPAPVPLSPARSVDGQQRMLGIDALPTEPPAVLAARMYAAELSRTEIGAFLGKPHAYNALVLQAFVSHFDLHGLTIDVALR